MNSAGGCYGARSVWDRGGRIRSWGWNADCWWVPHLILYFNYFLGLWYKKIESNWLLSSSLYISPTDGWPSFTRSWCVNASFDFCYPIQITPIFLRLAQISPAISKSLFSFLTAAQPTEISLVALWQKCWLLMCLICSCDEEHTQPHS